MGRVLTAPKGVPAPPQSWPFNSILFSVQHLFHVRYCKGCKDEKDAIFPQGTNRLVGEYDK